MIIRVKKDKNNPFVRIDRRVFEDERLRWEDKGLLGYLLSRDDDWIVLVKKDLIKRSPNGRDAVYKILKRLIKFGYLERVKVYKNGKIDHWEYQITELPYLGKQLPLPTPGPKKKNRFPHQTKKSKDLLPEKPDIENLLPEKPEEENLFPENLDQAFQDQENQYAIITTEGTNEEKIVQTTETDPAMKKLVGNSNGFDTDLLICLFEKLISLSSVNNSTNPMQATRLVQKWAKSTSEDMLRMRYFHMRYIEEEKRQRITKNPAGYFVRLMEGKIVFESGFDEWYDRKKKERSLTLD